MIYQQLIGKKIAVEFNGETINSFKFIALYPTGKKLTTFFGSYKIFAGEVDWEIKNVTGAEEIMDFDEKTLDDLVKNGKSICPFAENLIFKCEE